MPNQTGPRTAKDKALTRYNAATHGIYSVTPVLPRVERQACAEPGRSADWLAHRAGVFADLKGDILTAAGKPVEAKAAYQLALTKIDPKSPYRGFIQVKFDALGGAQ